MMKYNYVGFKKIKGMDWSKGKVLEQQIPYSTKTRIKTYGAFWLLKG